VLAIVAIVLALAGTTYAATQLARDSVGTFQLRDGSVTAAKLRDGAVTSSKLSGQAGCAINTVRIGPGCVETALRGVKGYREAVATCAAEGKRLPYVTELVALLSLGVPLGDPELVADVPVSGGRFDQTTLSSDGLITNEETPGTTRSFRCVASPLS
jgi:hypothetical protein